MLIKDINSRRVIAVSSSNLALPSCGRIYKSFPFSEAKPWPAKKIWISLPPLPAIFGNQILKASRVFPRLALSSINTLILEGLIPSALVAYVLNALASLLAYLASRLVKFSYFSIPMMIAILLLSVLTFTLLGFNSS